MHPAGKILVDEDAAKRRVTSLDEVSDEVMKK